MGAVQSVYGALLPPPEPPASPQQPGSSGGSAGTMFSDAGASSFGSAELAHACAMDEQQVRGATVSDRDLCMGVIACVAWDASPYMGLDGCVHRPSIVSRGRQ
jgi:hypothetical protein